MPSQCDHLSVCRLASLLFLLSSGLDWLLRFPASIAGSGVIGIISEDYAITCEAANFESPVFAAPFDFADLPAMDSLSAAFGDALSP